MRQAAFIVFGIILATVLGLIRGPAIHISPLEKGQWALFVRDYQTAYTLLEPLAKQGDSNAQIDLARMYENGLGVKQNIVEAYYWYRVEKWYQTDHKFRSVPTWNKLEAQLTDEQKSQVFKRVLEWKPQMSASNCTANNFSLNLCGGSHIFYNSPTSSTHKATHK